MSATIDIPPEDISILITIIAFFFAGSIAMFVLFQKTLDSMVFLGPCLQVEQKAEDFASALKFSPKERVAIGSEKVAGLGKWLSSVQLSARQTEVEDWCEANGVVSPDGVKKAAKDPKRSFIACPMCRMTILLPSVIGALAVCMSTCCNVFLHGSGALCSGLADERGDGDVSQCRFLDVRLKVFEIFIRGFGEFSHVFSERVASLCPERLRAL